MTTQDHAHEHALRAIGETQRTPDFKEARKTLVDNIGALDEAYKLGMVKTWGDFQASTTDHGVPATKINMKDGHDRKERTIAFDQIAYKQYGLGEAFVPQGQTDVVASFEDYGFNEMTRQFERLGWVVYGDGSVARLSGRTNEKGQFVNIGAKTNDVLDLHNANEYLASVIDETVLPEPQDS